MNWRALDWVNATSLGKRLVPAALCGVMLLVAGQVMPACSTTPPSNTSPGGIPTGPATNPGNNVNACSHPSPGCGCSAKGETAPCGTVILHSGNNLQCSMGTTTCDGAKWGECDGSIKVESGRIVGGGVATQGFGGAMNCGAANPCDPNCFYQTDTPPGIDAGAGLAVVDGGLEIAPPPGINTCNLPQNPSAVFSTLGANDNPGSCTPGASDNCNYDNLCTGTTCAPFGDGTTNAACTSTPDFTLGLGCWDASATTGLELELCNRGAVVANSGTLVVAIESGGATPTFTAGSCGTTTVLNGPAVGTTLNSRGTCSIPLSTTPIGPGECISFNPVNMTPAGITCHGAAGGPLVLSGTAFAMVNPPATVVAGTTPLAECDTCNNYTSFNFGSQPPLAGNQGACVSSWCGVSASGGSGSMGSMGGCPAGSPTALTGIVFDPGMNVALSDVAVYVATTAPTIPLPDVEPNPVGGLPYCDTCASLSTQGYLNGTVTDSTGSFTLYVAPGTYTVIAQLGRWRRIVSNVIADSCATTTIPATSIRMPRNQGEGDIPLTALVTADQEALECWLLQVGISASEIGPYSGTATTRFQLFQDNGQTYSGGLPSATTLFSAGVMDNFSQVMLPCPTSSPAHAPSAAAATALSSFANAGGRIFMNHNSFSNWIADSTPASGSAFTNGTTVLPSIATWTGATGPLNYALYGEVQNGMGSPDQQAFYAWNELWNPLKCTTCPGSPTVGSCGCTSVTLPPGGTCGACNATGEFVESAAPGTIFSGTGSASTELIVDYDVSSGSQQWPSSPNAGNEQPLSFWFNTPVTASAGSYCGRVVVNDMHVSTTRTVNNISTSQAFPTNCQSYGTVPETSEELALEYMFFHVDSCDLGQTQPVASPTPPPPPTPLTTQTYTRTFTASCPVGYTLSWGFFEWQDQMPNPSAGASISFAAETSGSASGPWGALVPLGSTTTSTTGMFATTMNSVNTDLVNMGQSSQQYLQVQMTLVPNTAGEGSPVLTTWQQLYDCIP